MQEFQESKVSTEGDELYYKVRGQGKPLLFIAPGGGNGDDYLQVADLLAGSYKIITYDRRANARSTRNDPNAFDIRQQSRDALAVLNAAGESTAIVIGNSSGAVIALDMATAYPQTVHAAIIHEAPIPSVLPDAEKWEAFFKSCYEKGKSKNSSSGATKFFFGIQMPAIKLMMATMKGKKYAKKELSKFEFKPIDSKEATDILIFNELLPITSYKPDYTAIKDSGVNIVIACGRYGITRNTWYASASKKVAEQLNSDFVVFPGHHGSFMDEPAAWADALLPIIQKAGW